MRKAVCLLMLVAGCPGAVGPEATAGRATVQEVFARCRQFDVSDAETDTLLIALRLDRDNGITQASQTQGFVNECNSRPSQVRPDCFACFVSAIDFVYD